MNDFSATAYLLSLQELFDKLAGNQKMAEALIYCYTAMLSKVAIAVIQAQSKEIFSKITSLSEAQHESEYVQKYCV